MTKNIRKEIIDQYVNGDISYKECEDLLDHYFGDEDCGRCKDWERLGLSSKCPEHEGE